MEDGEKRRRGHRGRRRSRKPVIIVCLAAAVVVCVAAGVIIWKVLSSRPVVADTVWEYFALLDEGDYSGMYALLSEDSKKQVTEETFVERNQNIYEGVKASDIKITMTEYFGKMGFNEEIPFELSLQQSSFDDDGNIDTDIQLADTGYGQGQLLVNPVHMLSMYSMFVNGGNMLQPVLTWEEGYTARVWKEQVVSAETADPAAAKPVAVVGMIEDVKGKGGSNYVTEKVGNIAAAYEE